MYFQGKLSCHWRACFRLLSDGLHSVEDLSKHAGLEVLWKRAYCQCRWGMQSPSCLKGFTRIRPSNGCTISAWQWWIRVRAWIGAWPRHWPLARSFLRVRARCDPMLICPAPMFMGLHPHSEGFPLLPIKLCPSWCMQAHSRLCLVPCLVRVGVHAMQSTNEQHSLSYSLLWAWLVLCIAPSTVWPLVSCR